MHRQQALKYRFDDSLMTENDTFEINTVIKKSQCLCGFAGSDDRNDTFFQVLKISRKNQNNKPTSKKLSFLSSGLKKPAFTRVL